MLSNLVEMQIGRSTFSFQILSTFYFEHLNKMKISLRSTSILFTSLQHVDINCQNMLSLEAKLTSKSWGISFLERYPFASSVVMVIP